MTREQLLDVALPPFRAAIRAGARALMTEHLLVPALDEAHPATTSPRILQELVREELAFDGLLISDAINMKAVHDRYGQPECAVRALAAGIDLVRLGPGSTEAEVQALRTGIAQAVREGALPEQRLTQSAGGSRHSPPGAAPSPGTPQARCHTTHSASKPPAAPSVSRRPVRRRSLCARPRTSWNSQIHASHTACTTLCPHHWPAQHGAD